MRKIITEDAGFRPGPTEVPAFPWAEQQTERTPAEVARRDMREIADRYAVQLRQALTDAGFEMSDNA